MMKSRLYLYIAIFLGFFLCLTFGYLAFFVRPQLAKINQIKEVRNFLDERTAGLLKARLTYVGLSNLDDSDINFYRTIEDNLKILEEFNNQSKNYFSNQKTNKIDKNILDQDIRVSAGVEEKTQELENFNSRLGKILEYDPKIDLLPLAASGQYDSLLGKIKDNKTGLEKYTENKDLQPEIDTALQSLTKLEAMLDNQNYEEISQPLDEFLHSYKNLKDRTYQQLNDILKDDASVKLLTDWTNLIISYQKEVKSERTNFHWL